MKKNNKKKNNFFFGKLFIIFFLIYGFYSLISGEAIRVWSIILSFVFLILIIIRPNLFTFLNNLWTQFGILLGKIMSPIVMGLAFVVVKPIGLLLRIFKKDFMCLKRGFSSYWINR